MATKRSIPRAAVRRTLDAAAKHQKHVAPAPSTGPRVRNAGEDLMSALIRASSQLPRKVKP